MAKAYRSHIPSAFDLGSSFCTKRIGRYHPERPTSQTCPAHGYLLQDQNGQITEAHSPSAGLGYPGVGPEHSWLKDIGRVKYHSVTDKEAWTPSFCSLGWKESFRHWKRRMLLPTSPRLQGRWTKVRLSLSACRDAATALGEV